MAKHVIFRRPAPLTEANLITPPAQGGQQRKVPARKPVCSPPGRGTSGTALWKRLEPRGQHPRPLLQPASHFEQTKDVQAP